ncbi:LAFA_0E19746g1_1 [Lachancea sp. 'fantastica']|nr:LAFA_0E19746g1_1 [Lachancea sp. 'fantastica']
MADSSSQLSSPLQTKLDRVPLFDSQAKTVSPLKELLSEILGLQDEILSLHRKLKTENAQIRRDVEEFCSIGNDDVYASNEPGLEGA